MFGNPKEHEKVMKAALKGGMTFEPYSHEKFFLHYFEYSVKLWEREGCPDEWTFRIGDESFTLVRDPGGVGRLIRYVHPDLTWG